MSEPGRDPLPLQPLLQAYCHGRPTGVPDLKQAPFWGPRLAAIASACEQFLSSRFLERAADADLRPHLERFYDACHPRPLHRDVFTRRLGLIRHGLAHLLHGVEPLPRRLENCLAPGGPYRVVGLGPAFWCALAQALQPLRNPSWTPDLVTGLRRLGLARMPHNAGLAAMYSGLTAAYAQIRSLQPELSAGQIDHFLTLAARMCGRELWSAGATEAEDEVAAVVARLRQVEPLRQRLKERGQELARAQELLQLGLSGRDAKQLGLALASADPVGAGRSHLDWGEQAPQVLHWVGQFWEVEQTPEAVQGLLRSFWEQAPLPGAGLWLPAAVLHLLDPQRFGLFNEEVRQGLARLDDSFSPALPPEDGYRLGNEVLGWLRDQYRLHPLEAPAVLAALVPGRSGEPSRTGAIPEGNRGCRSARGTYLGEGLGVRGAAFAGFCSDTFRFFEELQASNERSWMESNRDRYRFAVREPLVELCQALAQRYVKPVLHGVHGWQLITEARPGRALTSICRNAYGAAIPTTPSYGSPLPAGRPQASGRKPSCLSGWTRGGCVMACV